MPELEEMIGEISRGNSTFFYWVRTGLLCPKDDKGPQKLQKVEVLEMASAKIESCNARWVTVLGHRTLEICFSTHLQ